MRRKDREIRDMDQLEDILKECDAVRIAAQDEAGLFIVPMNFGYRLEGEKLTLSYWELTLNAEAAPGVRPKAGDTVLFRPGTPCLVTRVCLNLL